MHQPYIDAVIAKMEADPRIKAAWLEGSFGRGTPDRYSDLDFHFLLEERELPAFRADIESWLSTIRPLVLCTLLFEGRMVNALTCDGFAARPLVPYRG
jgi:predicted nucleotidyltransferase